MFGCFWGFLYNLAFLGVFIGASYIALKFYRKKDQEKIQELYSASKTTKDKVILHCFPKQDVPVACVVPWDLKIEMFCKMANISFEKDSKYPIGPKGKTPWISLNGHHMGDSQLIIEFLRKKFDVNLNKSYTNEQLAVARAVRVMLEERWYWAIMIRRWLSDAGEKQFYINFKRLGKTRLHIWILRQYYRYILGNQVKCHGIGRHTEEEAVSMHLGDLNTVSQILGNKKFILGDEPCEDDCAIFGQIVQAVWGLPNSVFEKFVNEEVPNLKDYCLRIKEKYWSTDWDAEY